MPRGSFKRKLLSVLGLAAFGGLLAAMLLEVGLRMVYREGRPAEFDLRSSLGSSRWVPHPFLPYAGRPNGKWTLHNEGDPAPEQIETNSYGFRTHEFPRQKRPEDYVILCLGESSTYGFHVESNEKTWPALLEAKLGEAYPTRHVEVFNLGVDMATTAVSLVNLALVGVHLQPDLVIVYQAFNDLSSFGYVDERTDDAHFYRDLCPEDLRPRLQSMLPSWLIQHSYAVAGLSSAFDLRSTPNDLGQLVRKPRQNGPDRMDGLSATLENFRTLHSIAVGRRAQILFSTFQFRDAEGEAAQMNDALRRFFAQNQFVYIDQDRLIPDHDTSINRDECHLTPKGDQLLVDNFYRFIVDQGWIAATN